MMKLIRPVPPSIEALNYYLMTPYQNRWFSNHGPLTQRLEEQIGDRLGVAKNRVYMTSSCTTALAGALIALHSPIPLVLYSEFTFIATAQAIRMAGKKPVPIFCDPTTLMIDPDALEARLKNDPDGIAALIVVRPFGLMVDLHDVRGIAARYGVPMIVDAAAAFGGINLEEEKEDITCYSTHATKPFHTGEGGFIVTNDDEHATRCHVATNFGICEDGHFEYPGVNGKMSEINAAWGLALLEDFDAHLQRRRQVARAYCERAKSWGSDLNYSSWRIGVQSWAMFPLLLPDRTTLDRIRGHLMAKGIEARPYYAPQSVAQHDPHHLCNRVLCLPIYSDMTDGEVERVIDAMDETV